MFKKVYLLLLLVFMSFHFISPTVLTTQDSKKQKQWVDSVLHTLTLEEQIGQLFMVAAYSNGNNAHINEIDRLINNYHIGGLIFFQGGPVRQAHLTNRYQAKAKVPLLIGIDAEWGLSMRLDSTIVYPKQMTLGAITDNRYIYNMGAEIARQCRLMGIHVNFAPVVDVNVNPNNPVIGYRSSGENKYKVAEKAKAYSQGMQNNRIIASAKHFPGHGDTDRDSHYTLPVIKHSLQRLDSIELYPFKELIKDNVKSIMVAHLAVPALDSTKNRATTLSPKVVNGLLKDSLGFNGLIFTDALNMKGVANFYKPGEVDYHAFVAGNDVLLFAENVPLAMDKIKAGIENGSIKQSELERRVRKILMAKYFAGLHENQPINTDNLVMRLNNPEAYLVKQKLFEQAITVVNNNNNLLPFKTLENKKFASLSIGNKPNTAFQEVLGKYAPFKHYFINKNSSDPKVYSNLKNTLSAYDHVIVGIHDVSKFPRNNYQINKNDVLFLKSLKELTNVVVVVFGNPYTLDYFKDFNHLVCAYEDETTAQTIAPQILFGALPAAGRLPVSAGPSLPEGSGMDTPFLGRLGYSVPEAVEMDSRVLTRIDHIAEDAIKDLATPGCQVLVAKDGKIVHEKSYGYFTYDKNVPVNNETVYDLASITKVAATLQATMFLEENGKFDIQDKASKYLPDLKKTNKEDLIIADILTHQAGLIPYIPYWTKTIDKFGLKPDFYKLEYNIKYPIQVSQGLYSISTLPDSLWKWTIDSDLRKKPRNKKKYDYKYSDLSFYILRQMSEKLLNQNISDFLDENFYHPLGLPYLGYLPLKRVSVNQIPPTENDVYFRNTLVRGSVHDSGAAMSGGVAGHAGLFSNAHNLAILMQMNLQGGYYGGRQYLQPATLKKFTKKHFKDNRRGLGWDKPSFNESYNVTSRFSSADTFGHTGFTGTAVWVDPEFDLVYIFLSNRVYPDATNTKLITANVRTRIHDVVYEAMWNYQKYL
ncbi:MAG: glycoside hydrolase family 3 N-terminal domain-containing protein [Cyclobacteriaceae bacterium]